MAALARRAAAPWVIIHLFTSVQPWSVHRLIFHFPLTLDVSANEHLLGLDVGVEKWGEVMSLPGLSVPIGCSKGKLRDPAKLQI